MKTIDVVLEELGMTVEQLAERSGEPIELVLAIVDGRRTPTPHERSVLAAALQMQVTEISWGHTMNPRNVRYHRFGLSEDINP